MTPSDHANLEQDDSALSTAPSEGAITISKLLNKLCFVVTGAAGEKEKDTLKRELNKFLRNMRDKPISKTAIIHWFNEKSLPGRTVAMKFILDFLENSIIYVDLSTERKKVYDQIRSFLRRYIKERAKIINKEGILPVKAINLSKEGNLTIFGANLQSRYPIDEITIEGTYVFYRMRISDDRRNPIAQEAIQIYRSGSSFNFEHWYLRDGIELDKFEGAIIVVDDVFWFLSTNPRENNRFRVMNFRVNSGYPEDSKTVLWGLMLSDKSTKAADEPAALRVLMIQDPTANSNIEEFARSVCRSFKSDDKSLPSRELIWRLVNNNVAAMSKPESTRPVTMPNGGKVIDSLLTVSKSTLVEATINLQNHQVS